MAEPMEMEVSENSQAPKAAKAKAAPKPKAALGDANAGKGGKGGKSIEETYQKLSQLEHILLRPDTYIGSTEKQAATMWVHDGERMVQRTIAYAPGLFKIFDEILVNAADNKVRDATMDTLRVDIDVAKGEIRVLNTGAGVPVEVHKAEGVYVPELIFGHLLTSSNYDDAEKKVTGGRNGYGAKLANIFSTRFVVETADGRRKRRYKQTFRKNMTVRGEPVIVDCPATENWTRVTFAPDLERFGMEELEADTVALLRKRVFDMAGLLGKGVKVFLDGERLKVKDFASYVDLYLGPKGAEGAPPRVYERLSDRWEACFAVSDGQFQQVSFVNAICTSKGGTHVNYVADQVVKHACEVMAKKHKQAGVKPFMVKNYLWVFLNCLVENPAFDSQTKETLTLRASAFGSKCELPDAFLKRVMAGGLADAVLSFASFKANKELKKGDGAKRARLTGIPKLDDANDAGGRGSALCTLILTEGDSAKSLAISGLSVVGRDKFGVFPLRGKLLNVRDAGAAQVTANAEITAIKTILGLQHGKVYTDAKSLRYGHLMIMTDQDHDGSHIKGLIMNFFHHFYPSLLQLPGFLVEFVTPIIKVTKGREARAFYTVPEYEAWREATGGRGWRVKYYKGLGTSTAAEAKEYFANIEAHRKRFVWDGEADGDALEMAFSKKRVEERKEWLRAYEPGTFLDHAAETISYHEFVHKELILFSRADLERSIPSVVDGLKPGQRKILYACFKRALKHDIKVAQLAGYVAEHSAYHHGEASLMGTIVGLAHDFVGTNNVNLLVPQGQFGTRLQGGRDAASPRYIFTRLAPLARHLFNEADDRLLAYQQDEGQAIEPAWYAPILPTVLVNGAEGIGTGWSTSVPNYSPRDLAANLKRMLDGGEPEPMTPWYRGFNGTIVEEERRGKKALGGRSYVVTGTIRQLDDTTLEITELPIRKWTQDYKEFLEELVKPEDKAAAPFITDYREHHTDTSVRFVVTLPEAKMREALAAGLEAKFKLTTKISIGNMMLFDASGAIKKYDGPEDVLREFYGLRLEYYGRRRAALLRAAEAELRRISNRVRFVLAVVSGELSLSNRRRAEVEADLEGRGFDRLPSLKAEKAAAAAGEGGAGADDGEEGAAAEPAVTYEYLLGMTLSALTLEKVDALREEAAARDAEVAALRATTAADMWRADLDAFLEAYEEFEADVARRDADLGRQQAKARRGEARRVKAAKGAAKGKKANAWSDDESEDDSESEEEDDFSDGGSDAGALAPAAKRAPAAAKKAPAPRARPAASASTSAGAAAPKAAAAPVPKPAAPAPPPPPVEEMSLAERMAARMGGLTLASAPSATAAELLARAPSLPAPAAAPAPKPAAKPAASASTATAPARPGRAAAAKKRPTYAETSDEEGSDGGASSSDSDGGGFEVRELESASDDDAAEVSSPPPRPAPKPAAPAPKAKPAPKPAPPKPAAKKPAAAKKAAASESEDEFELSDGGDSPVAAAPAPRAAGPRRAAGGGAKPTYAESEDEEESSALESEAEDDYCPSD